MKLLSLFLFVLFFSQTLDAQNISRQVLASAGSSSKTNNFQIDWTIGEVSTITYKQNDCIVSQGFHQSVFNISSIGDTSYEAVTVSIYPNPTREQISVNFRSTNNETKRIEVVDLMGRIYHQIETNKPTNKLNLITLKKGIYLIRIFGLDGSNLGTYKVIKYGF